MLRTEVRKFRDGDQHAVAHLTRGATLAGYEHVARTFGLEPFRILSDAGVPIAALVNRDGLISIDSVAVLLEESARQSGQEAFGLLLSEQHRIGNLGVLAAVLREEPTLHAALESLARYMPMQNDGLRLRVDDMGRFTMILFELELRKRGEARQSMDMAAGTVVRTIRALTHEDFTPVSVCFTHGRPHCLDVHRRILGASIDFSQPFNGIVCRSRDLDSLIPRAGPEVGQALKRWLDQRLGQSNDDPHHSVRQVIRSLIASGTCSVGRVANHLGTHRRTLNRHLRLVGENVSKIIDEVRVEMAESYLREGERTLCEVGQMLGFASGAEFSRWFREHCGMTASEWMSRRGLAGDKTRMRHVAAPTADTTAAPTW